jgi:uncharacterized SAM-binding protein YcdF (DUF218 family)
LLYVTVVFILVILLYAGSGRLLHGLGGFLVYDEEPVFSDAIVVLATGVEYYPRLIEAAGLYNKGLAGIIIINGNRKTDVLRDLEAKGFKSCCPWYEDSIRILALNGVSREKVVSISAEDAYETTTEAQIVGENILRMGYKSIILVTSKYHTRRASYIWTRMYREKLNVCTVSAKTDPYDPGGWWRDGRQVRWLMAEYGAWIYYYWKKMAVF